MERFFTAAVHRALVEAAAWSTPTSRGRLEASAMLLGLLAETECRAAAVLAEHGVGAKTVQCRWPELVRTGGGNADAVTDETVIEGWVSPRSPEYRLGADVEFSWRTTILWLSDCPQPIEFGTEHMLLGLVAADHEVAVWLRQQGIDPGTIAGELRRKHTDKENSQGRHEAEPLDMPWDEAPDSMTSRPAAIVPTLSAANPTSEQMGVLRVIDAAANRAREGLRVAEDYVRFCLDDRHLTAQFKSLRHDLVAALRAIPLATRLAARETQSDVGTAISTASEGLRCNTAEVLTANLTRLQESLRTLEEFGKVLRPEMAAEMERCRYRTYTLQRAVEITGGSIERLTSARLYVLLDGGPALEQFTSMAHTLVEAGVHVVQLRDKHLDDRRLIERARALREITRQSNAIFIMNDRPDVAALAEADGVHVGQEELTVKDARAIIGPDALVGVSTHSIEQARQAVLDGANYIGVGPTFPSGTKQFVQFPGLALLRAVAAEIRLPAFAIGGIHGENVSEVLDAGFRRIAVSRAITAATDPAASARRLLAALARAG